MKLNLGKVSPGLENVTTNKRINAEDKKPHHSVAALITQNDKDGHIQYLTQWHLKHKMLTPPCGKVKPDQGIVEALIIEMKEELDIEVENYMEILQYTKEYDMNGKMVPVTMHVFKVLKYKGTPKNAEPAKHSYVKYFTRDELEKSGKKLGDAYIRYFAWLDDINNPSLIKPHVVVGMGK